MHPITPDGRYFVVNGRLWRCGNPALKRSVRDDLVGRLVEARRLLRMSASNDAPAQRAARFRVDDLKRALARPGPYGGATAPKT